MPLRITACSYSCINFELSSWVPGELVIRLLKDLFWSCVCTLIAKKNLPKIPPLVSCLDIVLQYFSTVSEMTLYFPGQHGFPGSSLLCLAVV